MDAFQLDEALAADWLAGIVGQDDPDAFSLDAGYRASSDPARTGELVELAQAVGAIRCPEPGVLVAFEWHPDPASGCDGYRFVLEFRHPYPVILTVADPVCDLWLADSFENDEPKRGLPNAMGLLAQAVQAGNDMLANLSRYVAALAAAA